MCTIALAFHAHPRFPLVLASNRDEFYARPSQRAEFWADRPGVLAGRDLKGGGTWFGVDLSGRFGALTNVRQGFEERRDAPSRGEIVTEYLSGNAGPMEFASQLAETADAYNGFNLLVGDAGSVVLFSNRGVDPVALAPGVHGLTNAVAGTEWPKSRRARTTLEALLEEGTVEPDTLLTLLADVERPADAELPDSGVGIEWERVLSPIFIRTPEYGTRASTAFIVTSEGEATFVERSHATPDADVQMESLFTFKLPSYTQNHL